MSVREVAPVEEEPTVEVRLTRTQLDIVLNWHEWWSDVQMVDEEEYEENDYVRRYLDTARNSL